MEKLQVQVLKAKQLEPSGLLAYMLLIVLAVAVGLHLLTCLQNLERCLQRTPVMFPSKCLPR